MSTVVFVLVALAVVVAAAALLSVRIVKQYEEGVVVRLGRVRGPRDPGLRPVVPLVPLVPVVDIMRRVSKRIVTMPTVPRGSSSVTT